MHCNVRVNIYSFDDDDDDDDDAVDDDDDDDDDPYQAVSVYTSFCDLEPLSKSEQTLKEQGR